MVEEISGHPLIKGKNTALSWRAATICYYTQGFCQWARRDWATSLEKFQRVKQILDEHASIRSDLPKRYIRTLHYIINAQIELRDLESARANIGYMRELPAQTGFGGQNIEAQVFVASFLSELLLLDRSGEHEKAIALTPAIIAGMEQLGDRLHKEHEIEFYYTLARVHFGGGEMNKALFWLNKVLNDNESTLRQDIFTYARLFNLVIHYELGNYDLLEYIVRSTQRFLSKRQRADGMENVLMEHIRKLARTGDPSAKLDLFRSMQNGFRPLLADPNESLVLKYFDVVSWVTSHIEGVPFSEVVRRNAAMAD